MAGQTNLLTNGSFEFWTQYHPDHLARLKGSLPALDEKEPLVPVRWWVQSGGTTTLRRSGYLGTPYALRPSELETCIHTHRRLLASPNANVYGVPRYTDTKYPRTFPALSSSSSAYS